MERLCEAMERGLNAEDIGVAMRRRFASFREGIFSLETRLIVETEDEFKQMGSSSSSLRESVLSVGGMTSAGPALVFRCMIKPAEKKFEVISSCLATVETATQKMQEMVGRFEETINEHTRIVLELQLSGGGGARPGPEASMESRALLDGKVVLSPPRVGVADITSPPSWSAVVAGRKGARRPVRSGGESGSPRMRPGPRLLPRRQLFSSGSKGASSPAVVIRSTESRVSATQMLRAIKAELLPVDIGIGRLRTREAINGGIILEVLDDEYKADMLAEKIKSLAGGRASVTRPCRRAEFKVSGLDLTISLEEVRDAIAWAGDYSPKSVEVSDIKCLLGGLRIAWVTCPMDLAKNLVFKDDICIGWSIVKLSNFKMKRTQCYRCWHFGHTRVTCKVSMDRAGMCFRCAGSGHLAKNCVHPPCCDVCRDFGFNCAHSIGTLDCTSAMCKFDT